MRAEWAQTRARMCRWDEELLIIQEEMRRVLAFFEWKSTWWLEQGNQRQGLKSSIESGVVAYAHKQANICLSMATRCAVYWFPIIKKYSIDPTWSTKYKALMTDNDAEPHSDSDSEDDDGLGHKDDKSDVGDAEIDEMFDFN